MTTAGKLKKLRRIIERAGPAVVAFSGGTDSAFLAAVAREALGNKVTALTVATMLNSPQELRQAQCLARRLKLRHVIRRIPLGGRVIENSSRRCYYCKKKIFTFARRFARQRGARWVFEGSHRDDRYDFRPGRRALQELGIRSPLEEAGLTKPEIRSLSRRMGLPVWDKPSEPCLASRVAYHEPITPAKLRMIGDSEAFLNRLGFDRVRVRVHASLARVEVEPRRMAQAYRSRDRIVRRLKALGFTYVCIDAEGLRSGSMNEVLSWKKKK